MGRPYGARSRSDDIYRPPLLAPDGKARLAGLVDPAVHKRAIELTLAEGLLTAEGRPNVGEFLSIRLRQDQLDPDAGELALISYAAHARDRACRLPETGLKVKLTGRVSPAIHALAWQNAKAADMTIACYLAVLVMEDADLKARRPLQQVLPIQETLPTAAVA